MRFFLLLIPNCVRMQLSLRPYAMQIACWCSKSCVRGV